MTDFSHNYPEGHPDGRNPSAKSEPFFLCKLFPLCREVAPLAKELICALTRLPIAIRPEMGFKAFRASSTAQGEGKAT